jgi:hypothetical protein
MTQLKGITLKKIRLFYISIFKHFEGNKIDAMLLYCILSKEIPKIKCLNNFPVPPTLNKYII